MSRRIQLGSPLTYLLVAVLSAALTYYYFPKIEERHTVEEKEVVRTQVRTVIREVTRPDGSTTRDTVITDNSTGTRTSSVDVLKLRQKDWHLSASVSYNFDARKQDYGVQAQRRILGPVYLGAELRTDKSAGLIVGVEF